MKDYFGRYQKDILNLVNHQRRLQSVRLQRKQESKARLMEYQCWRNSVIRQLLSTAEKTTTILDVDMATEDTELLSQLPGSTEAFLCGFKIVYVNKICIILQLLPAVCAQMHRKRPPPPEEIDQRYRKRTEPA